MLLPKFHVVVNLLRHNSYACILNLKNVYRQWAITINSYCDFAYHIADTVWVDTSLVFGIKSAVNSFQHLSTSIIGAIAKTNIKLSHKNRNQLIIIYIDDILMTATTHSQALTQLNTVRFVFDRFVFSHDGCNTVLTSNLIYLVNLN